MEATGHLLNYLYKAKKIQRCKLFLKTLTIMIMALLKINKWPFFFCIIIMTRYWVKRPQDYTCSFLGHMQTDFSNMISISSFIQKYLRKSEQRYNWIWIFQDGSICLFIYISLNFLWFFSHFSRLKF